MLFMDRIRWRLSSHLLSTNTKLNSSHGLNDLSHHRHSLLLVANDCVFKAERITSCSLAATTASRLLRHFLVAQRLAQVMGFSHVLLII